MSFNSSYQQLIIRKTVLMTQMVFIVFLIVIILGIASCAQYREYRYEYLDRKEFDAMDDLYLIGMDIIDTSDLAKTGNEGNDVVFYSSLFIRDSFTKSFITEFNKNIQGKELKMVDSEKLFEWKEGLLSNRVDLGVYENKILPREVRGRWVKEFHKVMGGDGYVVIQFETSTWKQNAQGFFKVYNREGRVIWRKQIRDFSTYIILDKKSPYLIKNKQMKIEPNQDSFYDELKKVYEVLAKILVSELLEIFNES